MARIGERLILGKTSGFSVRHVKCEEFCCLSALHEDMLACETMMTRRVLPLSR